MKQKLVAREDLDEIRRDGLTALTLDRTEYHQFDGIMIGGTLMILVTNLTHLRKAKIVRGALYRYKTWSFRKKSNRDYLVRRDGTFEKWKFTTITALMKHLKT